MFPRVISNHDTVSLEDNKYSMEYFTMSDINGVQRVAVSTAENDIDGATMYEITPLNLESFKFFLEQSIRLIERIQKNNADRDKR